MSTFRTRLVAMIAVGSLALSACTSAATPAPTQGPGASPGATVAPTKAPTLDDAKTVDEVLAAVAGMSPKDREAALLAKAEKDGGKLVWYSATPAELAAEIGQLFENAYPSLTVEINAAGGGVVYEATIQEDDAGLHRWDVGLADQEHIPDYLDRELLAKYSGPYADDIPSEFKDPDGYWLANTIGRQILSYNTTYVTGADIPKDYEDVVNPKFTGRIGVDTEDWPWADMILQTRGQAAGEKLLRDIAALKPVMVRGGGKLREQMINGELDIIVRAYDWTTWPAMEKGAPIEFVYPTQGALVLGEFMVLPHEGPNPAGGVLFMDWSLSKEGQQTITDETGRTPVNPDVTEAHPELQKRAQGQKLWPIDVVGFNSRFEEVQKLFAEIFLGG